MFTACLVAAATMTTSAKIALAAKALVATGTVLQAVQPVADRIKDGKQKQERRA